MHTNPTPGPVLASHRSNGWREENRCACCSMLSPKTMSARSRISADMRLWEISTAIRDGAAEKAWRRKGRQSASAATDAARSKKRGAGCGRDSCTLWVEMAVLFATCSCIRGTNRRLSGKPMAKKNLLGNSSCAWYARLLARCSHCSGGRAWSSLVLATTTAMKLGSEASSAS